MSPTCSLECADDSVTRVSEFLIDEAELLDEHRLEQWFALFDEDARYRVLPLQVNLTSFGPEDSLFIIDDDHLRLRERVDSLVGGHTWMERPRSRTRRLLSNVRLRRSAGGLITTRSNFVVHQFRNREAWSFVGEATHVLRHGQQGLRIVCREIRLDHETICAQRRISIIL